MGMFSFLKDIGEKLFGSSEEAPAKIQQHIEQDNPGVQNLQVAVEGDRVVLKGEARDQAALEKAALMAGNVEGIGEVDVSQVQVSQPAEENVMIYEIQKGDTLWAIAVKFYGDGNQYQRIFEDNREVIKDPNKIYPGQKIRIVAPTQNA